MGLPLQFNMVIKYWQCADAPPRFLAYTSVRCPVLQLDIHFCVEQGRVRWLSCHHGMARPQDANGDVLQVRKVAANISKKQLDLVGVQEVKWDGGGTEPSGEYTIFYRKRNEDHV
jgi:hypothetical protein